MATIAFFAVLVIWAIVSIVMRFQWNRYLSRSLRKLNEKTQSIDVRKAKMWDMCVNATLRGEKIPQGVFFIDIRKPTTEEIEHGKILDALISKNDPSLTR